MKLRWSNGYSFTFEFEASDPESFREMALSALRSFRIAQSIKLHRGEIHKTVWRCPDCVLGVYDENSYQWYNPSGEPATLDTASFGRLSINRNFEVRAISRESDSMDALINQSRIMLICLDPGRVEDLDLSNRYDADRIWNLCMGVYEQSQAINMLMMTVGDALDNHLRDEDG